MDKGNIISSEENHKSEHCIFCTNHKSGDALYEVSKFDGAMDYISDIKFCPFCGKPLKYL